MNLNLGKENIIRGGKWVLGGICRETGDCFFIPVDTRDSETLLPLIKDHIRTGTHIISDCWAAYNGIKYIVGMNYTHETVNHSENFVDPHTGAHTQRIESTWHTVKRHLFPKSGTKKTFYSSYFAEHCIRRKYLNKETDQFFTFLKLITRVHVYLPKIP